MAVQPAQGDEYIILIFRADAIAPTLTAATKLPLRGRQGRLKSLAQSIGKDPCEELCL
jgi:hypothetical protein